MHARRFGIAALLATSLLFAGITAAWADGTGQLATELSEQVAQRLACVSADIARQPESLARANEAAWQAELAATNADVVARAEREAAVAEAVSHVDERYLEMQAAGPNATPAHFEFTSVWQEADDSANEDGSLGLWVDDWFTAHDWSEIGKQIASMRPGDVVTVDGQDVVIEGKFIWPQESTYSEIKRHTGWDAVIFQTCLGDDQNIWIVYGHPAKKRT